jgi:hypothetical protein
MSGSCIVPIQSIIYLKLGSINNCHRTLWYLLFPRLHGSVRRGHLHRQAGWPRCHRRHQQSPKQRSLPHLDTDPLLQLGCLPFIGMIFNCCTCFIFATYVCVDWVNLNEYKINWIIFHAHFHWERGRQGNTNFRLLGDFFTWVNFRLLGDFYLC